MDWEPASVQLPQPRPIQHHLPSRISWRSPGSPNLSVSDLISSQTSSKPDVDDDDDCYTNTTIEGLPTATAPNNLPGSSPYQYNGSYRQWQWQHLPARVY
ncbi:hypothetical protein NMY22_g5951 [Coprinellus aureogranulatus]|nr:hypothetical protein NMY22_g5951 [Coprinellus aureogranulatus]